MENTNTDKRKEENGEGNGGKPQVPPERARSDEELAMVHAAMLEELGIGRKDALPLEDRGSHGQIENIRPLPRQPASNNPWQNVVFDDVDPAMKELDSIADGQLYRLRRGASNGHSRGISTSARGGGTSMGDHANNTGDGRGGAVRGGHSVRGNHGGLRGAGRAGFNASPRPRSIQNDGRRHNNANSRIDAAISRLRYTQSEGPPSIQRGVGQSPSTNSNSRLSERQQLENINPNALNRNMKFRAVPPSQSGSLFSLANSSAEAFIAHALRPNPATSVPPVPSATSTDEEPISASKENKSPASDTGLKGSRWASNATPTPQEPSESSTTIQSAPQSAQESAPQVVAQPPADLVAVAAPGNFQVLKEKAGVRLSRDGKTKPANVRVVRDNARNIILQCRADLYLAINDAITDQTTLFAENSTITFCARGGMPVWLIIFPLPHEAKALEFAALPGGRNMLVDRPEAKKASSKPLPSYVTEPAQYTPNTRISSGYFNDMQMVGGGERLIVIDDEDDTEQQPAQTVPVPVRSALMDLALLNVDVIDAVFDKINSHKDGTLLERILNNVDDAEIGPMSSFDDFLNSLEALQALEMVVGAFFQNSELFSMLNDEEEIAYIEDISSKLLEKALEVRDSAVSMPQTKMDIAFTEGRQIQFEVGHHAAHNAAHYTVEELLELRCRATSVEGKIVSIPIRMATASSRSKAVNFFTPAFNPPTSIQMWQAFCAKDSSAVTHPKEVTTITQAVANNEPIKTDPTLWGAVLTSATDKKVDNPKSQCSGSIDIGNAGLYRNTTKAKQARPPTQETKVTDRSEQQSASANTIKFGAPPAGTIKHGPSHSDLERLAHQFNTLALNQNSNASIAPGQWTQTSNALAPFINLSNTGKSTQDVGNQSSKATFLKSQLSTQRLDPTPKKYGPADYFYGLDRTLTTSPAPTQSLDTNSNPALFEMKAETPKAAAAALPVREQKSFQEECKRGSPKVAATPPAQHIPKLANTIPLTTYLGSENIESRGNKSTKQTDSGVSTPGAGEINNKTVERSKGLAGSQWAIISEPCPPEIIPKPGELSAPTVENVPLFQRPRLAPIQIPTHFPPFVHSLQYAVIPVMPVNQPRATTVLVSDTRTTHLVTATGIATDNQINTQQDGFQTLLPTSPLTPITGFITRNMGRHISSDSSGSEKFNPDAVPFSPSGSHRSPLSPKKENIQANLQQRLSQSLAGKIGRPPVRH